MLLKILKVKIQEVTVTESNIDYPGSISLPAELMKASGIRDFEMVHVNNKTNGNRITTYAVTNKRKWKITINGAASKLFKKEDIVHILAYTLLNEVEVDSFQPKLIITDRENNIIESKPYIIS